MTSGAPTFTVGSAPHWRTRSSITRMNYAFILTLLPTALVGAVAHAFGSKATALDAAFGPLHPIVKTLVVEMGLNTGVLWLAGITGTVVLAMGVGVLAEYVCQVAMRQPYRAADGHGALMGLLVALLMPPTVPWWVLVLGVIFAIFLGKQIFGGMGGYPMHPAVVGWLILLLSWPHTLYPVGMASIAAPTTAAIITTGVGGMALWLMGYIRLPITVGVLLGVALSTLLFQSRLDGGVAEQILSGHVVLAAFYLATDSTCSPANKIAMWIHGLAMGFMIMLVRAYGVWPDAVPFAVLLINAINPLLDRIRPRVKQVMVTG